ncbi:MAG: hypothetical protein LC730_01595 [Acidobacteria bacterium]|nr:hypothetical protein [Acidobacteriota bacterium]MCA1608138.1 hypothetical protein [Acidobacteriota bacterium]
MKTLLFFTAILFSFVSIPAQTPTVAAQAVSDEAARIRLETFDKVWNTVNEKHYDPTFGGVDWNKVRDRFRPNAILAKNDNDLHSLLRDMLAQLKLSHFGILPKDIATRAQGPAGIGVELKMIDGKFVIWRVEANSTAEAAGLKPGFAIRKINNSTVTELLKPLGNSFAGRDVSDRLQKVYKERSLDAFISGPAESKAVVEIETAEGRGRVFEIVRKPFTGELSQPLGNFPGQRVRFESRRLEGNIGYIRFNMWVIPQMAKLRAAVREFAGARGVIFDLRGNPGGVGAMAPGIAGLLYKDQTSLGSMNSRSNKLDFIVYPQENPFTGTIVIITDHGTASTSEVFAVGMQETGRAIVIGETTAGAVLPSVFEKLPTGAMFQYAISDYRSPKNILIERRGVVPDVKVELSRDLLLQGRDSQLEAAIKQIVK